MFNLKMNFTVYGVKIHIICYIKHKSILNNFLSNFQICTHVPLLFWNLLCDWRPKSAALVFRAAMVWYFWCWYVDRIKGYTTSANTCVERPVRETPATPSRIPYAHTAHKLTPVKTKPQYTTEGPSHPTSHFHIHKITHATISWNCSSMFRTFGHREQSLFGQLSLTTPNTPKTCKMYSSSCSWCFLAKTTTNMCQQSALF